MSRVRSGTACDRLLETTKLITLSRIPEVVWQQPPEVSMDNFNLRKTNVFATTATIQTAHTPELRHEMKYNYQCRYRGEFYLKSGTATEQFQKNETSHGQVLFSNNTQNCHYEIQERSTHTTTNYTGHNNIPLPRITAPQRNVYEWSKN